MKVSILGKKIRSLSSQQKPVTNLPWLEQGKAVKRIPQHLVEKENSPIFLFLFFSIMFYYRTRTVVSCVLSHL